MKIDALVMNFAHVGGRTFAEVIKYLEDKRKYENPDRWKDIFAVTVNYNGSNLYGDITVEGTRDHIAEFLEIVNLIKENENL